MPVFNEALIIGSALSRLQQVAGDVSVIVVDGGSTDGSADIARRHFPAIEVTPAGRGRQMNAGGDLLETDILLFLHADSELPEGFLGQIRAALRDLRVAGGCFRLEFDDAHPMLRFYSWFTRFPGRFFHFGDQGFFVRREVFRRMGGFQDMPFLEDVDFLRRLQSFGRFAVLPTAIRTSARRFLRDGIVRQQLRNIAIVTLFELGFPVRWLARIYPPVR